MGIQDQQLRVRYLHSQKVWVTILNGGSDGWNIESVVTKLHRGNEYDLLTVNMDVKR